MHFKPNRTRCVACSHSSQREAMRCHECGGTRYVDLPGRVCEGAEVAEAMTGGWECETCGQSGPG